MKKIKFLLPIIALSLFSCSDYLDINKSPNNATGEDITPNLALSAAQTGSYREQARTMNRLGNFWMNNWGMNVNSFAVTSPQEFALNLDDNFYTGIWDQIYRNTANYSNIINSTAPNYENHKAIAKIMKAYYFQYLVDLYGDIPYFDAHKGVEELTPKYDDDKLIYRDLVVQLEAAIATIDSPLATTKAVGAEDVILAGDMAGWKRLANTIKLRILMRQRMMTDAETVAYLATEFAELSGVTFVNSNVTINPGYSNGSDAIQNPFYNQMYELNGTTDKNEFRFVRASKYMGDQLNSTGDGRGGRLFGFVGGNIKGVLQGDVSQANGGTAPLSISPLGVGLVSSSAQPGHIMSLSESLLLQAEYQLIYGTPATATTLFNSAIAASFAQLGAGSAVAYTTAINGVANIGKGFNAAATTTQKVRAIMYQKNIALQGVANAMESFIEHTRVKEIDNIPLAITGVTKPNKPRRMLYPNSEKVGNSANVPSEGNIFTAGAFWYVP